MPLRRKSSWWPPSDEFVRAVRLRPRQRNRLLTLVLAAAIVIGDGANDLAMKSVAGLSVAFRAKPVVQAKAHVTLNYAGLNGVLNLFR